MNQISWHQFNRKLKMNTEQSSKSAVLQLLLLVLDLSLRGRRHRSGLHCSKRQQQDLFERGVFGSWVQMSNTLVPGLLQRVFEVPCQMPCCTSELLQAQLHRCVSLVEMFSFSDGFIISSVWEDLVFCRVGFQETLLVSIWGSHGGTCLQSQHSKGWNRDLVEGSISKVPATQA
jgi:hypothetical protein